MAVDTAGIGHGPHRAASGWALGDLVRQADLGLRVVVGPEDALGAQVRRGYVTDLVDPRRYLAAGDLVLTSCLWYHGEADSRLFVRALADAGVVGLVAGLAGLARPGVMPDGLVAACRHHGLPLLTLGAERSFGPICETVLRSQLAESHGWATRVAEFQRNGVEAVRRDASSAEVLAMFEQEFALPCWLVTPDGSVVGSGSTLPTAAELRAVRRAVAGSSTAVVRVACGWGPSLAAPVRDSDGLPLGLLVVRDVPAGSAADSEAAVHALHGIVRLELDLARRLRQLAHRQARELVDVLTADTAAPGEVSAHLRLMGADPQLPTVVVAAGAADLGQAADLTISVLSRAFADATVRGCPTGDDVVVLVVGNGVRPEDVSGALRATVASTDALPTGERLAVGISDPATSVSQLSQALQIARNRLASARSQPGELVLVHGSWLDSHAALLTALPQPVRAAYAEQVLGPVVGYDALHGSDLLATLASYLDSQGSPLRSAQELHIHVNTLRYRVQRIEELTGRSLSTMAGRVDLYLALRCLAADLDERNAGACDPPQRR